MKKTINRLCALLLAVIMLSMSCTIAYATGDGVGDVPELHGNGSNGENGLPAGGRYMSNRYRDNYYLDIEELGITDMVAKGASFLANAIFSFDRMLVEMTAVLYYRLSDLDISLLVSGGVNDIQSSIYDRVFLPLLPIAVIALGLAMSRLLLKRNGSAVMGQFLSFMGTILMAALLATQTASVVKLVDDLTMGITNELITSVMLGKDATGVNNAATVAGGMWDTMIHQPWVGLNLDGDDGMVEQLLSLEPSSDERSAVIKAHREGDTTTTLFSKNRSGMQLGVLLFHTIVITVKCSIFLAICFLQFAFRIFTVLLMLCGGVLLFLALIPQLGGTRIIGSWGRKLLGIQLDIVMLGLLLGFVLWLDKLLGQWMTGWGWILVLFVQVIVCVVLFVCRDKIIDLTKIVDRTVSTRGGGMQIARAIESADMYRTGKSVYGGVETAAGAVSNAYDYVHTQKINFKEVMERRRNEALNRRPAAQPVYYYNTPAAAGAATGASTATTDIISGTEARLRPMLYRVNSSYDNPPAPTSAIYQRPYLYDRTGHTLRTDAIQPAAIPGIPPVEASDTHQPVSQSTTIAAPALTVPTDTPPTTAPAGVATTPTAPSSSVQPIEPVTRRVYNAAVMPTATGTQEQTPLQPTHLTPHSRAANTTYEHTAGSQNKPSVAPATIPVKTVPTPAAAANTNTPIRPNIAAKPVQETTPQPSATKSYTTVKPKQSAADTASPGIPHRTAPALAAADAPRMGIPRTSSTSHSSHDDIAPAARPTTAQILPASPSDINPLSKTSLPQRPVTAPARPIPARSDSKPTIAPTRVRRRHK